MRIEFEAGFLRLDFEIEIRDRRLDRFRPCGVLMFGFFFGCDFIAFRIIMIKQWDLET